MGYTDDVEKTAILDVTPVVLPLGAPINRTKRVFASVVLAVAAVGALVAFQARSTDRHVQKVVTVEPLTLSSVQASQPGSPAETPNPFMLDGADFMIVCLQDNRCVDDGETPFHLWNCDPPNSNQHFVYDASTRMIKNPYKNRCWDDGGSPGAGLRAADCSGNVNTKFLYDWTTRSFRNPNKPGKCVDAGSSFSLQDCDPTRPGQQFEIVPKGYY